MYFKYSTMLGLAGSVAGGWQQPRRALLLPSCPGLQSMYVAPGPTVCASVWALETAVPRLWGEVGTAQEIYSYPSAYE